MNDTNLRGTYAGFVTRAAGLILDILIIMVAIGATNWLSRLLLALIGIQPGACQEAALDFFLRPELCIAATWTLRAFTFTFPFLYLLFFWTLSGQTPGKFFMRLRIVSEGGGRITLSRAVRRLVGYWVSFITLGYGFLIVLVEDHRRGLHDRIAGTWVIYDWDARQNVRLLEKVNQQIAGLRRKAKQPEPGSPEAPAELPETVDALESAAPPLDEPVTAGKA